MDNTQKIANDSEGNNDAPILRTAEIEPLVEKIRKTAQVRKTAFRSVQAIKMKKQFAKNVGSHIAQVGSKVAVIPDKRDVPRGMNIFGIAFEVGAGGGCRVVTEHGIVSANGKLKQAYFVPLNQYRVLDNLLPVSQKLEDIRNQIVSGKFRIRKQPRLGIKATFKMEEKSTYSENKK
jgi:hypothetical protein